MIIGKIIKLLREEKNISQSVLAKNIGVHKSTISLWENEINGPKAGYIIKLAKFFNVTADYLLGLED